MTCTHVSRLRVRREWSLPAVISLVFLPGCSPPKEALIPVTGTITVRNQLLSAGTVVFRPDREKGNKETREPRATIAADQPGVYRLTTDNQDGAPAGWYKVTVNAIKPATSSVRPPEWLASQRYADETTSELSVEVTKGALAGAYDFKLDPPR
jgi:hypothetical protein